MFAKGLAAGRGLPLWGVNHLAGHALTPRLVEDVAFPYLMLLVSGGHGQFLAVEGPERFVRLGGTIDDAPGEAFDKVAKLLGLGQPGGPAVEAEARAATPAASPCRARCSTAPGCDLSFSGLKTAVRRARDRLVEAQGGLTRADRADLCAGFQAAVAETLAEKTRRALAAFRAAHGARRCWRSPAASRRTARSARRWRAAAAAEGAGFLRAAAGALHRQRRDDRLGGGGADGGGRARRPGAVGPPALAARRDAPRRCSAPGARGPRHDRGDRRRRLRHRARRGAGRRGPRGAALGPRRRGDGRGRARRARRRGCPACRCRRGSRCTADLAELAGGGGGAAGAAGAGDRGVPGRGRGARCPRRRWCSAPRGSTPAGFRLQTEIAAARAPGRRWRR